MFFFLPFFMSSCHLFFYICAVCASECSLHSVESFSNSFPFFSCYFARISNDAFSFAHFAQLHFDGMNEQSALMWLPFLLCRRKTLLQQCGKRSNHLAHTKRKRHRNNGKKLNWNLFMLNGECSLLTLRIVSFYHICTVSFTAAAKHTNGRYRSNCEKVPPNHHCKCFHSE